MYLVPKNVSQRFEFFPGLGWREIFTIGLGLGAGVMVFFFLGLFTASLARILIVGLIVAVSYFLVRVDPRTGKTVLDLIKDAKQWKLGQRRFLYFFGTGGVYFEKPKEK